MTAVKVTGGTFDVTAPGEGTARVRVDDDLGTDAINAQLCIARAIQAIFPMLPPPWDLRYAYAIAQWKLAAYQRRAQQASGATRNALNAKREVWVAEEARLKAIMGTDA